MLMRRFFWQVVLIGTSPSTLTTDPGNINLEKVRKFYEKLAETLSKTPRKETRAILANLIDEIKVKRSNNLIYGQIIMTAPAPVNTDPDHLCPHVASPWSY